MRRLLLLLVAGLLLACNGIAAASAATADLLVTIAPPAPPNPGGPITLEQTIDDGSVVQGADCCTRLSTSPIPTGATVFGWVITEGCFVGDPFCTVVSGDLDLINVGNQQATLIRRVQDARYNGDGLGLWVWWLNNVQGNPTTIDFVPTAGGQFWYGGSVTSVFTGIPSTATIDTSSGAGYASTGSNGNCCADGFLESPPITPQAGDFLYGAGAQYGSTPSGFGPSWSGSNLDTNAFFGKADEYIPYSSTSPIAATFPAGSGPVSWATAVGVKIQ
jgi:hypothetical protein